MRQVVLDTETTGLEPSKGHRIIEVGCVELEDRKPTGRHFHVYINPQREVDPEAMAVHGITNEFLLDKPLFSDIATEFVNFIRGAQLVIHNAPFDVGFMNHEFAKVGGIGNTTDFCTILDTLVLARKMHPGAKNNLNALCRRYDIDVSHRELHGALLDAEILADVYLMMTGGQTALILGGADEKKNGGEELIVRLNENRDPLLVVPATADELKRHEGILDLLDKKSDQALWRK
jgi:DNA polymerase-3 subunit epsilon